MIIRKLPLWVLFGLVLLLAPLKVQAACGSWIASPEGCYDESSTRIEGETVMCGRGSTCCSTIEECSPQEEDPFGGIDEPVTPVDEPEEPAPPEPVPEDDPPPAPTDPVCAGNTMGPCPAGQSCQQMILSGGARQNSCQPTGNPQEILDPSDDGWPMSEDEITDALYEHCGTYYANDSGGRCVDINTDDISPFTLCSGAGGADQRAVVLQPCTVSWLSKMWWILSQLIKKMRADMSAVSMLPRDMLEVVTVTIVN